MTSAPLPPDPFAVLRGRIRQGVRASDLCVAVMGWLCDTHTVPSVLETRLEGGQVWLRLSNERCLEPLCPFLDFLNQVRVICVSLGMTDAQTAQVVAHARHRLG